jgi:hypothetical protein
MDAIVQHFFSLEVPHKKHILWHDCHMLCMNGTFVAVFKISYQVLSGLLEDKQGSALHAQGCLIPVTLNNLADKTLKWCLPDQ